MNSVSTKLVVGGKNRFPHSLLCLLLFAAFLLAACGGGGGNGANNTSVVTVPPYTSTNGGADVTVQNLGIKGDTVIVDTSNSAVQVTLDASSGKTTVVLPSSSATNQIQPGAPLVIGVSAATPEGYLGKVEQVSSQGGSLQVTAVPGKLSDFIADCDMSIKGSLQTSDIQTSKPLVAGVSYAPSKSGRYFKGIFRKAALITTIQFKDVVIYDKDGNLATTSDQVLVNGSLDYGLDYQFDLKASNFKLQRLQFVVTPWQAGDFTLSSTQTISVSKNIPVKTISFKPFTIWIPITPLISLPVVITPVVTISVGVDGQLSASLSTGFTESSDISGGVLYSSGLWQPVSSQNISLSATMPTVSANASLTAYIEPKVIFKIYGQIAPYAAPRGYLRFTADTAADPWWELYGGLKMGVGITVTVVGYDLVDYANDNVIGYELLIASPPTAPQNPTVSSGNGQATVSWSAVTGATSYNLYWDTLPVVTRLTANKITGVTSPYVHTGLTNGTTYYYMVTAENSLGEGAGSTTVSTIPIAPKPGVPAGVSASAGNGQVTVSWMAVTGATSYNVYYKASTAGVTIANGTKVTAATSGGAITGLINGTAYYFIVTAVNAGGESAASTEVGATPQVPAPGAPTGVSATAADGQVAVSWAAVTGAISYNVYYRTTAGVTTVNGIKVTGATSGGAITGLTNGTKYYFVVTAMNAGGESAASAEVSAIPVAPVVGQKVPDTGQTTCYDSAGTVIACAGTGQDGAYTINPPSYTDNGDGTITDNVTGLMWQKQDDATLRGWATAGTYCTGLNLGGHADWRLPSRMNLITIVNAANFNSSIDATYFPSTQSSHYWSSATYASTTAIAWYVTFSDGYVYSYDKAGTYSARCVRLGQSTAQSFADNGDGTITDNVTTMMWQKQDDGITKTWANALTYCTGLNLGGHTDWRLPNYSELSSIVDDTVYNPAINATYFPSTQSSYYWSSTTYAYSTTFAWVVYFLDGRVSFGSGKPYTGYARCVRLGQ